MSGRPNSEVFWEPIHRRDGVAPREPDGVRGEENGSLVRHEERG